MASLLSASSPRVPVLWRSAPTSLEVSAPCGVSAAADPGLPVARVLLRPVGDALQKVGQSEILFRPRYAAAHGNPRRMDGLGIARDQRMPPVEILPFRHETIGAGRRQPGQGPHALGRQADAIGDLGLPVVVVGAPASLRIEQRAAHIGVVNLARILVLELDQAAAAAAVAQALPLAAVIASRVFPARTAGFRVRAGMSQRFPCAGSNPIFTAT